MAKKTGTREWAKMNFNETRPPVKLLEDILGVVPAGGLVLDPFYG